MPNHALQLLLVVAGAALALVPYRRLIALLSPKVSAPILRFDPVVLALQQAFVDCGLPRDEFNQFYDLSRAGKLNEVLHHAAMNLSIDHPLRTVGDVANFLRRV